MGIIKMLLVSLTKFLMKCKEEFMSHITGGQMLWKLEEDGDRVLHLRHNPSEEWRHYEEFPEYALQDPVGFSKGISTFMSLLKKDWTAIKS